MKNRKKFTKGCLLPRPPPLPSPSSGGRNSCRIRFPTSIYPARSIYISNVHPTYLLHTAAICPARKPSVTNTQTKF